MNTRSRSLTSPLGILLTVFAIAALPVTGIHLSADAISSTSASNGTINIGTHPPKALRGAFVPGNLVLAGVRPPNCGTPNTPPCGVPQ